MGCGILLDKNFKRIHNIVEKNFGGLCDKFNGT